MGRLRIRAAVAAGLRARFRARFVPGEPLLELALAPRRLVHAEKPLVHVVADDVVERRAVIADHQNDHANLVVGHEGNLRVETGKVAAMISKQVAAIRCRLPPHAIGRIEQFPKSQGFPKRVWQANGLLQRGFQNVCRQDLFAVVFPVIHQGNEPVGQLVDIGKDGASRGDAFGVLIIGNLVELEGVALFPVRNAVVGMLRHVGDREASRAHSERREDPLAHEIFPALPGLQFDNLACGRVHQVVVEKRLPHRLLGLQVLQLLKQLLPRKRRLEPDQIVPRHDLIWFKSPFTRKELFEKLKYLEPQEPMRETFLYNNLMYSAAGQIIELKSGKRWEDFVRERIFTPLGMSTTSFTISDMTQHADHGVPYRERRDSFELYKIPYYEDTEGVAAAGAILANIDELSHWLIALMNDGKYNGKQVLPANVLKATLQPAIGLPNTLGEALGFWELLNPAYGMGRQTAAYRGHLLTYHGGDLTGFHSQVSFLPNHKTALIVL